MGQASRDARLCGEKPRAEKEKRKKKELAEMAREAFARQEKYGYIELCELIQEMLEVKERTAKGYIAICGKRKSSKRRATAMYTDREEFEGWMERIMERFDRTEKLLERVLKKNNTLDGEEVLDNQDLCLLLRWASARCNVTVPSGCCRTSPSAEGVLPHEGRARVHPHPLRRSGGTGCETQGEGSPESGKAQEKGAVPVRMTFF